MRRSHRWLLLPAALLGSAFAPIPKPKAPTVTAEGELKKLQGTWMQVSLHLEGAKMDGAPGAADVIRGDQLTCRSNGEDTARWTVVLDPAKAPRQMDLLAGAVGQRLLCIYRLDGDTLTVCFRNQLGAKDRPADFTPRKGVGVSVLKRKRP